jgi:hypothetical protein
MVTTGKRLAASGTETVETKVTQKKPKKTGPEVVTIRAKSGARTYPKESVQRRLKNMGDAKASYVEKELERAFPHVRFSVSWREVTYITDRGTTISFDITVTPKHQVCDGAQSVHMTPGEARFAAGCQLHNRSHQHDEGTALPWWYDKNVRVDGKVYTVHAFDAAYHTPVLLRPQSAQNVRYGFDKSIGVSVADCADLIRRAGIREPMKTFDLDTIVFKPMGYRFLLRILGFICTNQWHNAERVTVHDMGYNIVRTKLVFFDVESAETQRSAWHHNVAYPDPMVNPRVLIGSVSFQSAQVMESVKRHHEEVETMINAIEDSSSAMATAVKIDGDGVTIVTAVPGDSWFRAKQFDLINRLITGFKGNSVTMTRDVIIPKRSDGFIQFTSVFYDSDWDLTAIVLPQLKMNMSDEGVSVVQYRGDARNNIVTTEAVEGKRLVLSHDKTHLISST